MSHPIRRFKLLDDRFSHGVGTVAGVIPEKLIWIRRGLGRRFPVFFSHEKMLNPPKNIPKSRRFGLLIESTSQANDLYRDVELVMDEYSLVFTHSSHLLHNFQNARWIPGGGIWIGGSHGGTDSPAVFPKTKAISIVSSNKLRSPEHTIRYQLSKKLEANESGVDVFRQLPGRRASPIQLTSQNEVTTIGFPILASEYLKEYRYSIVIENQIDDLYFTEKILNCFATGTVPLYRGARNIGSIFDADGIIPWSSPDHLLSKILPSLSENDYQSRRASIAQNFTQARHFRTIEDFIIDNYFSEIEGF